MKFKLGSADDDGNSINLPIHEFGNAITSTYGAPDDVTKSIVMADANEFKRVMSFINDVHWVKEPDFVMGPQVDMLQRFQTAGWHALMASQGYVELRNYFEKELKCKKEHVPDEISLRFVIKMAKRWLDRIMQEDEQVKRCDCEDCCE